MAADGLAHHVRRSTRVRRTQESTSVLRRDAAPAQHLQRGPDGDDVPGERPGEEPVGLGEAAQQGVAMDVQALCGAGDVALLGDVPAYGFGELGARSGEVAEED